MRNLYAEQVRLLVQSLPAIARESVFALKGGTAINLFYRDMPRLSVDIDLTYLPVEDRETSLRGIDEALGRIVDGLSQANPGLQIQRIAGGGNNDTRILIGNGRARIKVETSPVMRGTVMPPRLMQVSEAVEDEFGFAEMQVVAFEDLFGGKLHAALDRTHPRDLYDVKLLYDHEGLTDDLFRVFLVYVACSGRPMHELLGTDKPAQADLYTQEFVGMTREPVSLEELEGARERLVGDIRSRLGGNIAAFLLSLHDAQPDFDLIGLTQARDLPAVRWKCVNLERLKSDNPPKHAEQRMRLESLFR